MTDSVSGGMGSSAQHIPQIWGRVPPRNKNFTGRADLLAGLRGGLADRPTAVVSHTPHALHGLGGVGKTQMAVEYAHRYRGEYDLVWWVPADQPALVQSTLAQLAPRLGLPSPAMTGIEEAAENVLDALRRGDPYRRWLLIFDNADEPEDINEILPRGPGHVLITSRNHRWEGVVETVQVDVFPRAESVEFLRKRVRQTIGEKDADRLAEALGDLPLALEQAGALQAETGMSVEEYLRLLSERTRQILDEGRPTEYPRSMTAAWDLSVATLQAHMPEAIELLRSCAFFGPEPIPRDVFAPTGDEHVRPEMARLLSDPIRLSAALSRLGRYALVRIDKASRTVQVHRLIQALLREALDEPTRAKLRDEVHTLLAAAAPASPADPETWVRYSELLAHVLPGDVHRSRRPDVRNFALRALEYLFASGNYRSTRRYAQILSERWTADSGPESIDVLKVQRLRANLLREMGRYGDAYELDEATLETMSRLPEPDQDEVLILRTSIGADLRAHGEFAKALAYDEESLEMHDALLGPENIRTLRAVNGLALDYGFISDYRASRELHHRAFQQLQQLGLDYDKIATMAFWSGLARVVRLCGDYSDACDIGDDAHAYSVEQLGVEHPWTLRTAKDLAIARLRSGEYEEAHELALDVHARCVRLFGLDNPDTLAAAICLSNVLRSMGEIDEAFKLASDTLHRYPRIYGPDHPYQYGCAGNVAVLYRVQGDAAKARAQNQEALEGLERKLTRDHHYSLAVAINLASDLARLDEVEDAVALGRGTLRRLRAVLGGRHPMTLACAANLSIELARVGEHKEAEELRAETEADYAATLSLAHRDAQVFLAGRHLDADFDPSPI
ncbi:FxSxx-COOH system tetratricopeptide repeat protein [Spirillospora sp. CA-253888]